MVKTLLGTPDPEGARRLSRHPAPYLIGSDSQYATPGVHPVQPKLWPEEKKEPNTAAGPASPPPKGPGYGSGKKYHGNSDNPPHKYNGGNKKKAGY